MDQLRKWYNHRVSEIWVWSKRWWYRHINVILHNPHGYCSDSENIKIRFHCHNCKRKLWRQRRSWWLRQWWWPWQLCRVTGHWYQAYRTKCKRRLRYKVQLDYKIAFKLHQVDKPKWRKRLFRAQLHAKWGNRDDNLRLRLVRPNAMVNSSCWKLKNVEFRSKKTT